MIASELGVRIEDRLLASRFDDQFQV